MSPDGTQVTLTRTKALSVRRVKVDTTAAPDSHGYFSTPAAGCGVMLFRSQGWRDSSIETFGRFITPCLGVESPRLICNVGLARRRRPRRTDSNLSWFFALALPNLRTDTIAAVITTEGFTLPTFPIGIGTISRRTCVARNAIRSNGTPTIAKAAGHKAILVY